MCQVETDWGVTERDREYKIRIEWEVTDSTQAYELVRRKYESQLLSGGSYRIVV